MIKIQIPLENLHLFLKIKIDMGGSLFLDDTVHTYDPRVFT